MNLWYTLLIELVIYVIVVFVLGPLWYIEHDRIPNTWGGYRWLIRYFHRERCWTLIGCWAVMFLTALLALLLGH